MGRAPRHRAATLAALAALAGAGLAAPSGASGALTATDARLAGTAAYDQVVVHFTGGRLTGLGDEADAVDPSPADGRAIVRVTGRGITAVPGSRTRAGVAARRVRRPGSILVVLTAPVDRFSFVSYGVDGSRTRLVIRLWRATTSARARILDDGCLRLTRWAGGRGTARIRGLELVPLFEHNVVTALRADRAGDDTIALRPRIATGFRFRPDFTGYLRPGRFGGPLPYSVAGPTRAMLQAFSLSAKDGALECLVQTPVILRP